MTDAQLERIIDNIKMATLSISLVVFSGNVGIILMIFFHR